MKTDELKTIIIGHVREYDLEIPEHKKERLARIRMLLRTLTFLQKYENLSLEEKEDYAKTKDLKEIPDDMQKVLDNCKSEDEQFHYIGEDARRRLLRRVEWENYLYGSSEKPFVVC